MSSAEPARNDSRAVLVDRLRRLRQDAGDPSARHVAQLLRDVSHTTVAEAFNGKRVPSWSILKRIVRTLGGNPEEFQELWTASQAPSGEISSPDTRPIQQYKVGLHAAYATLQLPAHDTWVSKGIEAVFVPPDIGLLSSPRGHTVESQPFAKFASNFSRTVLLGGPGAGKSTLTAALALMHSGRSDAVIPFLLRLRDFVASPSGGFSILQAIEWTLQSRFMLSLAQEPLTRILASQPTVLILDGLDEVDIYARSEILTSLRVFSTRFPKARILLTSRPLESESLDHLGFDYARIVPFNRDQIDTFVRRWSALFDSHAGAPTRHLDKEFLEALVELPELISNPLLLTLLCSVYQHKHWMASNRSELVGSAIDLLLQRWDSARGFRTPSELDLVGGLESVASAAVFGPIPEKGGVLESDVESLFALALSEPGLDLDSARGRAREIMGYLRARSGLLTEIGHAATGEPLYDFAHAIYRDFLAASYIVKALRDPQRIEEQIANSLALDEERQIVEFIVELMIRWEMPGADYIREQFLM